MTTKDIVRAGIPHPERLDSVQRAYFIANKYPKFMEALVKQRWSLIERVLREPGTETTDEEIKALIGFALDTSRGFPLFPTAYVVHTTPELIAKFQVPQTDITLFESCTTMLLAPVDPGRPRLKVSHHS